MSISESTGNLIDTLTHVVKSRVSSKFGSAFLFSWLIFNWEFLYFLLLGDHTVERKLNYIELHFLSFHDVLVYPIIASSVYIILFPVLSESSEFCWNSIQQYISRKASMKLEGKIPLDEDDKRRIYNLIRQTESKYRDIIVEKDKEIATLQAVIVDETGSAKWKDFEENVQEDDRQSEIPVNIDAYSDIVRPIVQSEDGRYLLTNWLADQFGLNKDNSLHKQELNEVYTIFQSIILELPESWRPKELKSAIPLDNRVFNKDKSNAMALKFVSKDLLSKSIKNDALIYNLTERSLGALEDIFIKISNQSQDEN